MDFVSDLRKKAETTLGFYGLTFSSSEDTTDILRRWLNLQLRLIKPIPRKVFKSNKIHSVKLNDKQKKCLKIIEDKFSNGDDLNPYLSTKLFKEDYTDNLFADWAIYHLHLNNDPYPKNPYFVDRPRPGKLLFLMVTGANVYFIDVRNHGKREDFACIELLQIVHDTWPELIEPYRKKCKKVEKGYTDPTKIYDVRKYGSIIYKIRDVYYGPIGGGVNTWGTSINVVDGADQIVYVARHTQDWAYGNLNELIRDVQKNNPNQTDVDLHLEMNDNGFFVVDTISQTGWKRHEPIF